MRISDWSSDVCSSDLGGARIGFAEARTILTRLAMPAVIDEEKGSGSSGTYRNSGQGTPGGAVHEGHAAVSDVRLFRPHRAGAQAGRRQNPSRQCAGRSGSARQPPALLQLADVSAVEIGRAHV